MDNELYDYRKYDQIWKRVNPQENPYPEARGGIAPRQDGDAVPPVYQTLLRDPRKKPETFEDLKALQAKIREICQHTPLTFE